jgi:hypothetical protein
MLSDNKIYFVIINFIKIEKKLYLWACLLLLVNTICLDYNLKDFFNF